ncbi:MULTISPECIES: cytochrome c maturation protein CcmE [Devosia]|uniref:cytochrome c maturation protein CcmE n=1 Tax=Devosia TaxID=46913 RepID=UPI000CE990A2|nr:MULTISPECIES: cytochrome c maturation protein CcmE [Devosia]AVF02361.1 cytochrome c maturation protein CcmE [Devosia sp. I507]
MTSGASGRKGFTRKQKRLVIIAGLAVVSAISTALVLTALRDQIVFFYAPSDLSTREVAPSQPIRLGDLVKEGSWSRSGQENVFVITDGAQEISTRFTGILPDLFREGQGVVAEGAIAADGRFEASDVLAKHDENYVPKEVVEALKAQGEWRAESAEP